MGLAVRRCIAGIDTKVAKVDLPYSQQVESKPGASWHLKIRGMETRAAAIAAGVPDLQG